jgi:hypothetical protein
MRGELMPHPREVGPEEMRERSRGIPVLQDLVFGVLMASKRAFAIFSAVLFMLGILLWSVHPPPEGQITSAGQLLGPFLTISGTFAGVFWLELTCADVSDRG